MEFDDPAQLIASLRIRTEESPHGRTRRNRPAIVLAGVALDEKPRAQLRGYMRTILYSDNGRFDLDQIRAHLQWFGRAVLTDAVFVVIVDGNGPDRRHSLRDYTPVLAAISAHARHCGSELVHAWHVPALDPGSRWTSLTVPAPGGVVTGPPPPTAVTEAASPAWPADRGARYVGVGRERELLAALDFLVARVRGLGTDEVPGRK